MAKKSCFVEKGLGLGLGHFKQCHMQVNMVAHVWWQRGHVL